MLKTVFSMPETVTQDLMEITHHAANQREPVLVSYSLPWVKGSLIGFLRHTTNAPRVYWESNSLAVACAGVDVAATLIAHGHRRFQLIRCQTSQLFRNAVVMNNDAPSGVGPRLFGGFAFEAESDPNPFWSAFPAARFLLPRYQLSSIQGETWLTINHVFDPTDDPLDTAWTIHEQIRKLQIASAVGEVGRSPQHNRQTLLEYEDLVESSTWQRLVAEATQQIRCGELEKVVLARARRMVASIPVDPVDILIRLKTTYPNCYRFLFEPVPGHAFYGATPELLAEVGGSDLRTVALAGSIRRGKTRAEDAALGRQLLANPKERHEHALVVDAVKENLEPIVTGLEITSPPDLLKLSNIQHLKTDITATLNNGDGILPVVEALHPTPALGGRPRHTALSLIKADEPISRGWYGSPIGWIDHQNNGTFAVAIRSAVSVGKGTMLYAGAGIVADSVPEKEWRETELKFKPLMDALGGNHA